MAERAGGDLHAGNSLMRDMNAEVRAIHVVRVELFNREETALSQNSIECAARMSFAEDKAIAERPRRVEWIHIEHAAVKHRKNIRAGERGTDMRATAFAGHAQYIEADAFRQATCR